MAGKNLYELLGVSPDADISEIKQAYRKLAFEVHPDTGANPDPDKFREIHEAYQVLSDPERRKNYDASLQAQSFKASSMRRSGFLIRDVDEPSPFFAAPGVVRFAGPRAFRRLRPRHSRWIEVRLILDPVEAAFGCRVPLNLEVQTLCPYCDGMGGTWTLCPLCHDFGVISRRERISFKVPAGVKDGDILYLDLASEGLEGVNLAVAVSVR